MAYAKLYFCLMPFTLYMLLVGCRPPGRFTEQHDTFFAIAQTPADLIPKLQAFWPEVRHRMHVDAIRPVRFVDGFSIAVQPRGSVVPPSPYRLFFLNLGGYRPGAFDEAHYKMLAVATEKKSAIRQAKETAFFKHTGFKTAPAHIDNKYGVDVDDVYEIADILMPDDRRQFALHIEPAAVPVEDKLELGYITFDALKKLAL